MDAKLFLEALEQLETDRHLRKEAVEEALKEALKKAYIKNISAADDANVVVTLTDNPPTLDIKHIREVVADDDEEDKSLQISLSDANRGRKAGLYSVGDEYVTEVDTDSLSRLAALAVKSILKQKFSDLEKEALYETHKDNVGTLISGSVEKCDERGAVVTIDQSSFNVSRKDMIGDEMFKPGDPIQFYLSEVSNGSDRGPSLKLSRSDEGFLKCVIDDEIPDIHNGLVVIKKIVREAGVRSKVAVYSTSSVVDPIMACIGKGSSLLRAVCKRVGTSSIKEKVNFVQYSDNILAYACEALRPATVLKLGVESMEITGKDGNVRTYEKVIAIVGNDDKDLASALGARAANLRLASKLIEKQIEVIQEKELADSDYSDLEFVDAEVLRNELKAQVSSRIISQRAEQIVRESSPVTPVRSTGVNVKYKPQQILDEDIIDEVKIAPETEEPINNVPSDDVAPVTSPVAETPVTKTEEVPETRVVKTTTTLESLEASLETSKKKEAFKGNTKKRPHKITDDEVEDETKKAETKEETAAKGPQMDIYSQEEIEQFENEDLENEEAEDEDIDYEDYEEYYDDNK